MQTRGPTARHVSPFIASNERVTEQGASASDEQEGQANEGPGPRKRERERETAINSLINRIYHLIP